MCGTYVYYYFSYGEDAILNRIPWVSHNREVSTVLHCSMSELKPHTMPVQHTYAVYILWQHGNNYSTQEKNNHAHTPQSLS